MEDGGIVHTVLVQDQRIGERADLEKAMAHQALQRIGVLFQIETQIRGKTAPERWQARQERTRPALQELRAWLTATLAQVSAKSPIAIAIGYTRSNWTAFTRFVDDGRIEAHNNAAVCAQGCGDRTQDLPAPWLRRRWT